MLRLLTGFTVLLLTPALGAAQSIEGVWQMVEREIQGGDDPGIETGAQVQPGLLFYTEGYFAYVLDNADATRAALDDYTDAQVVEVVTPLAVAAGTYEFDGSTLRYDRMVSINPNAALPENQPLVRQVDHLTRDRLETSVTNEQTGVKTILKYERVE